MDQTGSREVEQRVRGRSMDEGEREVRGRWEGGVRKWEREKKGVGKSGQRQRMEY